LIERKWKTKCVQEERKKDQEHKILSWFTLPQGLRPVRRKLAKISTKNSPRSVLHNTILLPAVHILLPAAHALLKVSNRDCKIQFVETEKQLIDFLTKPLARDRFNILRTELGILDALNVFY